MAVIDDGDRAIVIQHMEDLEREFGHIGARSALKHAAKIKTILSTVGDRATNDDVMRALVEVESRFSDFLDDIKLFVIPEQQIVLFSDAADLISQEFADQFPTAKFEIEEAAKCLALSRPNACAFHAIRVLEIGVRAIAKHLGIADPTKPAEKSWGLILGDIKKAIDAKWPANTRLPKTAGAELEGIYVTLDAVKNPWRNATMHVENTYTDFEAQHILQCVGVFMQKVLARCDEQGVPSA